MYFFLPLVKFCPENCWRCGQRPSSWGTEDLDLPNDCDRFLTEYYSLLCQASEVEIPINSSFNGGCTTHNQNSLWLWCLGWFQFLCPFKDRTKIIEPNKLVPWIYLFTIYKSSMWHLEVFWLQLQLKVINSYVFSTLSDKMEMVTIITLWSTLIFYEWQNGNGYHHHIVMKVIKVTPITLWLE